jgi:hypothetical protein
MPNLPVSIENDITVQNNTTGQVGRGFLARV